MKFFEDAMQLADKIYAACSRADDKGDEHVIAYAIHIENMAMKLPHKPKKTKTKNTSSLRALENDLNKLFGGAF